MNTSTSVAPSFDGLFQSRDQPAIFGDVVGGPADRLLVLRQHGAVIVGPDHRPIPGRPRVTARPAVGLDYHLHEPDPFTRNKIAPHSGQRNTSSSAAAEMRASSPRSISIRHAPQRRPCSSPAPGTAARPLTFIQCDEIGVQVGDEFVAPRDGLVSQLIDLGAHLVARPLRIGELVLQLVDRRQLTGLLTLQLLSALHHLKQ